MKQQTIIGLAAVMAVATMSLTAETTNKLSFAERMALRAQKVGGYVVNPKSYQGSVVIVNKQTKLHETNLVAVAELFERETRCRFRVSAETKEATVALTVVDDPNEPAMLLAPDDHWGTVNLAKIVADLPSEKAKEKFFSARARKMVIRALSILCGGAASSFPGNAMNAATVRDLDQLLEQIPIDMSQKYSKYLPQLGITPKVVSPYVKACREGWAPAPTNDVQKAIWDKVHAMPKKPMKIEFDPKKGR